MATKNGEGSSDNTEYGAIKDEMQDEEKIKPQLATCFGFFLVHKIVTVLSLFSLAVAQFLPSPHDGGIPFFTMLLRLYIFVGCMIGIIVELDTSEVTLVKKIPSMESWVVRGSLYLFLGLIATEESTVSLKDLGNTSQFFSIVIANFVSAILWVSAIGVVTSGVLYVVMGLLMLKGLREKYEREHNMNENGG